MDAAARRRAVVVYGLHRLDGLVYSPHQASNGRETPVNTSIDNITFTAIPGSPITMGAIELSGADESITIGTTTVSGPGTVSVWRWESGRIVAQVERPNGDFEKVDA